MESTVSRSEWRVTRTEARGRRGAVAAKHPLAVDVGIDVLRDGGSAVDAAVAMAFALGVVEPYMSGIGGGGFMVLYDAARGASEAVDFAMIAPRAAGPDTFRLVDGGGPAGFFGWDAVEGEANIVGHRAAAIPGAVAGLLLAHQRHGRLPRTRLLEPAIALAHDGVDADWFASLMIAGSMAELSRFPASAGVFVPRGRPPRPYLGEPADRLVQRDLAETLRAIAAGGADAFYRGAIAEAMHDEMARHGGLLTRGDLAAYRPRLHEPGLLGRYRGHTLVGVPAPSGGPTVLQSLAIMDRFDLPALGLGTAAALHVVAEAGLRAFADRFAHLSGDESTAAATTARLLDPGYIDAIARDIDPHGAAPGPVTPGDGPDRREHTTTTLAVADGDGNVVVLTSTLLSIFGSAVTVPGTGILLNNGMMWFDPRPGRPNSVGPGKRPLNNMSPLLVLREGRPRLAIGAMGGRRIIGAVTQIVSNVLDFGMSVQEACAAPRLDASTGALLADPRLSAEALAELRSRGRDVTVAPDLVGAFEYGSPAGILIDADGTLRTGVDPLNPAAAAAF